MSSTIERAFRLRLMVPFRDEPVQPASRSETTACPIAAKKPRRPTLHVPIYGTDQVADVTGAGDTVIATFTLALAAGATPVQASLLANYAGGIVVMKRGTATVSEPELRRAVGRDLAPGALVGPA